VEQAVKGAARGVAAVTALVSTLAMAALLLLAGRSSGASATAAALTASCPASLVAGGHDYHGLTLTRCSFNGLDLTNANFQGATLTAVVFANAQLGGADFSGATIADSGNTVFPTDFSFADLSHAKFVGTRFDGPTYLTYANLSCADFSHTDLGTGNTVFGDQPLVIGANQNCRARFRDTTMNCEFVSQWGQFDLTGARIAACASQLQSVAGRAPHDFSGGMYAGVVFDNLDLSGSKWTGAVLEGASFQGATLDNATGLSGTASAPARLSAARFNKASLQNVDLSNAELYGAQFTDANLRSASLAGAFLSANTQVQPPIETAAKFDGAHLRDVNLSNAKLQGASFQFASFYGSFGGGTPAIPCKTGCSRPGFTCACATASGANLTGTNFSNAYLFGVDFTGATTTINGTQFGSAILTGASFAGAQFQVNGGAAPDFNKALLQGTTFDANANLVNTSLLDAFVDFGVPPSRGSGNVLFLLLSADYTRFRGWTGASTPCVQAAYASPSVVPSQAAMTCSSGNFGVCGAGNSAASVASWKSGIAMSANAPVPGWYANDATYDSAPADTGAICKNNATLDPNW
jgi:uncharacterized protein YjbI with pentapeptide repeats